MCKNQKCCQNGKNASVSMTHQTLSKNPAITTPHSFGNVPQKWSNKEKKLNELQDALPEHCSKLLKFAQSRCTLTQILLLSLLPVVVPSFVSTLFLSVMHAGGLSHVIELCEISSICWMGPPQSAFTFCCCGAPTAENCLDLHCDHHGNQKSIDSSA